MLTFSELIDDVEDIVDEAIADFSPTGTLDLDPLTGQPLPGVVTDLVDAIVPELGGITAEDIAEVVDDVVPLLTPIAGGPFGFAPVLSLATDLLTGETIETIVDDTLDFWFDRDNYLAANPDVADANLDPFLHFLQSGALENRLPDLFDENFYLENNPDVGAAVASDGLSSGWIHFLTNGASEGRSPSAGVAGDTLNAIANTLGQLTNAGLL